MAQANAETERFMRTVKKSIKTALNKGRSGGAHGVMVIVVGNGHGDSSSNPGRE